MSLVGPSGNPDIDGLLWGYKWDALHLTYTFPTSPGAYHYQVVRGFEALNGAQEAAIQRVLANYANVCGLSFSFTASSTATLKFGEANAIKMGPMTQGHTVETAEGYAPDADRFDRVGWGSVWYNHTDYNNPLLGSDEYANVFLHEIGHALGLKHGHATQLGHGTTFPALPDDHNSFEYSIMTYSQYVGDDFISVDNAVNHPTTLMMDDIAALQYLYGADYSYNRTNTTYTFNPSTGEMSINGAGQGRPSANTILLTIWDGGGNDTYNFSNYASQLTIDLNPGGWTSLGRQRANLGDGHVARGNIANAYLYRDKAGSLIENAIGGKANDHIFGNKANNNLYGNGGKDTLDGRAGADGMFGGAGNDTYYVDNSRDRTIEAARAGTDRVFTRVSYALAAGSSIELLSTSDNGTAPINLFGNELANVLLGNNGKNLLRGGRGDDVLQGGGGFDTADYSTASGKVTVSLSGIVGSSSGADGHDDLVTIEGLRGSRFNDTLIGNTLDNVLYGGAGADRMTGGAGKDTYYVDNAGDRVIEVNGGGTDRVLSSVSHTLASYVENLTLTGTANIKGTGNGLDNIITGNAGSNVLSGLGGNDKLDGGRGADTLVGGPGNDTYYVDNSADRIVETAGAGTDRVFSSITYTLSGNVENLTLTGSANINGTGNAQDNVLIGNNGDNVLSGGSGGDDIAYQSGGNDRILTSTYVALGRIRIDHGHADKGPGQGTDDVFGVHHFVGSKSDDFIVGGGFGETIEGEIRGPVLDYRGAYEGSYDFLSGGGGNDVIIGRFSFDTLTGGDGADRFVYQDLTDSNTFFGTDTITDFTHTVNLVHTDAFGSGLIGGGADTIPGDKIDLSLIDADLNTPGDQAFVFAGNSFSDPHISGAGYVWYWAGDGIVRARVAGSPETIQYDLQISVQMSDTFSVFALSASEFIL